MISKIFVENVNIVIARNRIELSEISKFTRIDRNVLNTILNIKSDTIIDDSVPRLIAAFLGYTVDELNSSDFVIK